MKRNNMDDLEKLQKLYDEHQVPVLEWQGTCHDCGEKVCVEVEMDAEGKITARGGALYLLDNVPQGQQKEFLKCDACYKKDSTLRNFRECEVYSRVVGFLRPVKAWNAGKQEEYKLRRNFKIGG